MNVRITQSASQFLGFCTLIAFLALPSVGQQRIKTMPGYDQYQKMSGEMRSAVVSGAVRVGLKTAGPSTTLTMASLIVTM